MKDRIRRDRQFWQTTLADQANSELTIAAYCREHELSQGSFYNWKKRLSQTRPPTCQPKPEQQAPLGDTAGADISSLIELTVASSVATPDTAGPQRMLEASRADGTLLRFHGSFDPDMINQIIAGQAGGKS